MMGDYVFSTISLKSWQEFKEYINIFNENWAFRGQGHSDWILNNAIERTYFINFHPGIEAEFVAEFQRGARNYLSRDETPQHLIEWLALMQHHGAPTRLLDLSKSPFIAAYFAFEFSPVNPDHSIGIWGINHNYLKERAIEFLSEEFGEALEENKNLINEQLFEKLFYENNKNLVFPVEPFSMNRRYSIQQSIFLSTGTTRDTFMNQLQFLGEDLEKTVVKMVIPGCHRREVMRDLQQMNLHRASLFPDLDGYALSLRLRYDNMRSPQEKKQEEELKSKDQEYPFIP
jgi:hypothetical protein